MKKQTASAIAAVVLLSGVLRIFQEHAETLSGEIVDFVFAFSCAIVFGLLGYFRGNIRGNHARRERQKSIPVVDPLKERKVTA